MSLIARHHAEEAAFEHHVLNELLVVRPIEDVKRLVVRHIGVLHAFFGDELVLGQDGAAVREKGTAIERSTHDHELRGGLMDVCALIGILPSLVRHGIGGCVPLPDHYDPLRYSYALFIEIKV